MNDTAPLLEILMHKFKMLGKLSMEQEELSRFVNDLECI